MATIAFQPNIALLPAQRQPVLSEREQRIYDFATIGFTDKEIAEKLGIKPTTVKSYWLRIRQKTRSLTRNQAISVMSTPSSSVQAAWWQALLERGPFSILVCAADWTVLVCRLANPRIENGLLGRNLRNYAVQRNTLDAASDKVLRLKQAVPFSFEIDFHGWRLALSGNLMPGGQGNVAGVIYLIEKVVDLSLYARAAS